MRRIGIDQAERGVIAPLTAILMVVLLGMAAFAVDVATMYSEHSQLQNGADAAAIGVAQICAANPADPQCTSPAAGGKNYTDGNALDKSTNTSVAVNLAAGTVDVTTHARDADGSNHFSLNFARALGIQTADISASAQAKFGGFSSANVIPLAFSKCESDPNFQKGLMFFPEHGNGLGTCPGSPSGQDIPGGFGWLTDGGACNLQIDLSNPTVASNTGNGKGPKECTAVFDSWSAKLSAGQTVETLVPIFDDAGGNGANGWFHIQAFAQLSIRGWHFNSNNKHNFMMPDAQAKSDALGLKTSDNGLFGYFVRYVSIKDAGTAGGPTTYGAVIIQLSK